MVAPTPPRLKAPEFICIGRPRCGTRFLYDALQCFRDVWMPPIKEIDFWTQVQAVLEGPAGARGIALSEHSRETALRTLDPLIAAFTSHGLDLRRELEFCRRYLFEEPKSFKWYLSLFGCAGDRVTGDITPAYYKLGPTTIAEVRRRLPDVRIIVMTRDPVDQLWSLYNTDIRYGRLPGERRDDVDQVREWLRQETHFPVVGPGGMDNWLEAFPDILVIGFEDIIRAPGVVLPRVGEFLGCEQLDATLVSKLANVKSEHTPAITDHIRDLFAEAAVRAAVR